MSFVYAKTNAQISFVITSQTQLISAFVFATQRVQFLFYFYPKFQAFIAFFCDSTARFVLDLVGNPKDQFSLIVAPIATDK